MGGIEHYRQKQKKEKKEKKTKKTPQCRNKVNLALTCLGCRITSVEAIHLARREWHIVCQVNGVDTGSLRICATWKIKCTASSAQHATLYTG